MTSPMFIARFTWSGPWCGTVRQVSLPSLRRWHVCTCDFLMHMNLRWPLDVGVGCPDCCNPGLLHVPCWSILVCNIFCFYCIWLQHIHSISKTRTMMLIWMFFGMDGLPSGTHGGPLGNARTFSGCKNYQTKLDVPTSVWVPDGTFRDIPFDPT